MATCTFCNQTLKQGTGTLYIKIDGKVLTFCSGKCEKNMIHLKRNPSKQKWVTKRK